MTAPHAMPAPTIAELRQAARGPGANDRWNEERLARRHAGASPGADGDPHMEECAALRLGGQESDGEGATR